MELGEAGEHVEQVEQVVPDEGGFELAEVGAHVEHVRVAFVAGAPEREEGLEGAQGGGVAALVWELGEQLEHDQVGIGAGVRLAPRAAECAELGRNGARPAGIDGKSQQVVDAALEARVIRQAEFDEGVKEQGGIAERPGGLVRAGAAVGGGDVHGEGEGPLGRLQGEDLGDNAGNRGIGKG